MDAGKKYWRKCFVQRNGEDDIRKCSETSADTGTKYVVVDHKVNVAW